ncbi:uncharacterized protein LOC112508007 [Cynara cardunculus var. scolymus]|uniref:Oxoglutarate/iron-dependent dioxygenase n=1 Tax=Cynara cardunculus var. scolymus TaxID=59895 RepID=A0A103YLM4_CYNCS|nr:uncharacterized protein LOC112508007 [Cynara cardunculus var. scolymus]KVI11287.1 Oxoglutarate/iron-dependent dioxygenase [Cynara cardunculus var. scolymus]
MDHEASLGFCDDMGDERDLSHHPSLSHSKTDMYECASLSLVESLGSYDERKTNFDLRHHPNQTSNEWKKDLDSDPLFEDFINHHEDYLLPTSFGKQKLTYCRSKVKKNHKPPADHLFQTEPFSLILPRSIESMCKRSGKKQVDSLESSSELVLRSGMVLLKKYLSLSKQVEIVNRCEELGVGPGGFYQPGYQHGPKLQLHMMCLGRNWDPQTKYSDHYRSDGSEAPPIPDELIRLVTNALQYSQYLINSEDELPMMSPDVCIVNFYATSGRLGLHQDRDESSNSLSRRLPVVSISIGDSADFLYDDTRDVKNAAKILLESGDVLIFGGKSRHIFHGVTTINQDSAPLPLLKQTMLRPGRLNLTFRQF